MMCVATESFPPNLSSISVPVPREIYIGLKLFSNSIDLAGKPPYRTKVPTEFLFNEFYID